MMKYLKKRISKTKSRSRSHSIETEIDVEEEKDPFCIHIKMTKKDGELPVDVYHTDSEIIVQGFCCWC